MNSTSIDHQLNCNNFIYTKSQMMLNYFNSCGDKKLRSLDELNVHFNIGILVPEVLELYMC